jgi:hypothetical protein
MQRVIEQFELKGVTIPADIPEGVYVAFAESDSVRVECDQDRVSIVLAISELAADQHRWRNFFVRAHYAPQHTSAFRCDLVREGPVELQGKRRLSATDDFELRAVFTKVFSKNRSIPLIHPQLTDDPRMQDLQINQFVARDGWVGISVAQKQEPRQAQQRQSTARSATQAMLDKLRRR